jgi:cyclophilin family peptidyl-prolyl cis-trans isomerase
MDFDPSLKPGDMGVFFLKEISQSTAKLAYAGSVALFPKPNFKVSDKPAPPKPGAGAPRVKLETSMGDIVIELNPQKAPITVKNFLRYVEEGHYDRTIFHRVIKNFMIQGGGFTENMTKKPTHEPIVNEANNGLKNLKGTIVMARQPNPNSAKAQFFINHKDNHFLNYVQGRNPGYAVFGKVVQGMDVVDAIANVKTTTKNATRMGSQTTMKDVPAETVLIKSVTLIATP